MNLLRMLLFKRLLSRFHLSGMDMGKVAGRGGHKLKMNSQLENNALNLLIQRLSKFEWQPICENTTVIKTLHVLPTISL